MKTLADEAMRMLGQPYSDSRTLNDLLSELKAADGKLKAWEFEWDQAIAEGEKKGLLASSFDSPTGAHIDIKLTWSGRRMLGLAPTRFQRMFGWLVAATGYAPSR